jgi:hypothetical protein
MPKAQLHALGRLLVEDNGALNAIAGTTGANIVLGVAGHNTY